MCGMDINGSASVTDLRFCFENLGNCTVNSVACGVNTKPCVTNGTSYEDNLW